MRATEAITEGQHPLESEGTTELIGQLMNDMKTLVREELTIAKLELSREAEKAKSAGKAIGIGAFVGTVAVFVFAFGLVFLLAEVLPLWAASGIVAAVLGLASFIAIKAGVKVLKKVSPERAIEPLKEEGRWIKETVQDVRSHRLEHTLH